MWEPDKTRHDTKTFRHKYSPTILLLTPLSYSLNVTILAAQLARSVKVCHFNSPLSPKRSVNLKTKLSSRNFSQKRNGRICFSILMTRIYLKLEIEIQVSGHQHRKINSSFHSLGEVTARQFCFDIY